MWLLGLYINKGNKKLTNEEFREIFLEFYPGLCLFALKFVGDPDTSKDIVHDVLERFWLESEKLNQRILIKPYLYKAVKNRALNYTKREKRKFGLNELLQSSDQDLGQIDFHDAIAEISFHKLHDEINLAINELPEQRRLIFSMSRFQQKRHKEIAKELGISVKTVETQIYRSLAFLQKRLHHFLNE